MSEKSLVWLNILLGKSAEARSIFDTLQDEEISSDIYNLLLGCILALEGDFEAAVAAFEQAPYEKLSSIFYTTTARTFPDTYRATCYAWSLIDTGRQEDADKLFTRK